MQGYFKEKIRTHLNLLVTVVFSVARHKEEEEASRRRATKRDSVILSPPHTFVGKCREWPGRCKLGGEYTSA